MNAPLRARNTLMQRRTAFSWNSQITLFRGRISVGGSIVYYGDNSLVSHKQRPASSAAGSDRSFHALPCYNRSPSTLSAYRKFPAQFSAGRTFSSAAIESGDDGSSTAEEEDIPIIRQRHGVRNLSILAHVDHGVSSTKSVWCRIGGGLL